jgi:Clp amino terminal domain, pathogenicity island component
LAEKGGSVIGCDTDGLFEMLTEHAREAIVRAQAEGREMGHRTVQVEHLLLGLFSDQDGIAGRVFADIGLTVEPIRDLVRERLGAASDSPVEREMPFSPEATDALRSANRFGLGKPGTEHMLIVTVGPGEGAACEILRVLGGGSAQDSFRDQAASLAGGRTGGEANRAARWLGTAGEPGRARLPWGYRGSALSSTVASRMAQELDRADPVALIGRCAGAEASEAQRGCHVGLDTLTFGESWHAVIVSVEAPVNSGSVCLGDEVDEDGGDPRPTSSPEENHPNSTLSTRRRRACG